MDTSADPPVKSSVIAQLEGWGKSSMPAMGMATLVTALHFRPFQPLPMLFAPVFVMSSYINMAGWKIDSAGITAAWSGLYVLLALRRRQPNLRARFSARGAVRGAAIGLGAINALAGGVTVMKGDRKAEKELRTELDRWGMHSKD